jgi:hypothetical protein
MMAKSRIFGFFEVLNECRGLKMEATGALSVWAWTGLAFAGRPVFQMTLLQRSQNISVLCIFCPVPGGRQHLWNESDGFCGDRRPVPSQVRQCLSEQETGP